MQYTQRTKTVHLVQRTKMLLVYYEYRSELTCLQMQYIGATLVYSFSISPVISTYTVVTIVVSEYTTEPLQNGVVAHN